MRKPRLPSRLPPLRRKAEAQLAAGHLDKGSGQSAEKLLHELQVYQIELEMQNETLRQSQAALEEARNCYTDLYDFAPMSYLTLNPAGVIAAINLTGARLLAEERSKLLRRRFEQFVAAQDQGQWREYFSRALQHIDHSGCELTLMRSDGTSFVARLDGLHAVDDGATPMLRVALTDVSEVRRLTKEIQASEERLRLAQEATGLGIFDREILTGRYYWDQRSRDFWGVGPDEPIGFEVFMAGVHPEDRKATQAAIDRALDPHGSGIYSAEYRVISRADGYVRTISATGQAYFEDGQAVRLLGALKDISAQIALEQRIQAQRGEMDQLIRRQVAAHTAAAIAHELNQPLVAVSAYSETALRILHKGLKNPEKLMRVLEGAIEQAQRAGRTLHALLDFLHKGQAEPEPIDLKEVVEEAIATAMESGYAGFHPVLELESGLSPVRANRLQVQKVLVNLLCNGVEAMRLAGMAKDAIVVSVRGSAARNMAQVTVRDSGPGLDAETAERIFEPFFTTKPQGIGLGLAISRALIESHGGQLWVELGRGPGATFHFTLPFAA